MLFIIMNYINLYLPPYKQLLISTTFKNAQNAAAFCNISKAVITSNPV